MGDLHLAAYHADVEHVLEFLDAGDDPNEYDQSGYTPLLWAAFRGAVGNQLPVILALISAGADVNAVTRAGDSSVLMLAVQAGSDVLVRALVELGAEVDRATDEVTPLMLAARIGEERIARTLLELGADPTVRAGKYTAADYAWQGGHDQLARQLESCANAPRNDESL
ncbi:ankyrin repeat domain-containing protein [Bradyrhizobium sp. UFLA05-153]